LKKRACVRRKEKESKRRGTLKQYLPGVSGRKGPPQKLQKKKVFRLCEQNDNPASVKRVQVRVNATGGGKKMSLGEKRRDDRGLVLL